MFTKAEVMLTGSFAETVRRRQVRREQPLFRRMRSPAGSTNGIGGCLLPPDISFVIFKKAIDSPHTSRYDVSRKGRYGMDVQLKRGLLDVCVLAAIKSEDSYGYKIIKDMKPYIELSESTLYTILKRLETANMLTVRTAEHGGRLRKYYHITDEGLKRIEDFKNEWEEIMSIYRFVTKEDNGDE